MISCFYRSVAVIRRTGLNMLWILLEDGAGLLDNTQKQTGWLDNLARITFTNGRDYWEENTDVSFQLFILGGKKKSNCV